MRIHTGLFKDTQTVAIVRQSGMETSGMGETDTGLEQDTNEFIQNGFRPRGSERIFSLYSGGSTALCIKRQAASCLPSLFPAPCCIDFTP